MRHGNFCVRNKSSLLGQPKVPGTPLGNALFSQIEDAGDGGGALCATSLREGLRHFFFKALQGGGQSYKALAEAHPPWTVDSWLYAATHQ